MRKSLLLCFMIAAIVVRAEVTLPKIFGDNMVLQRDRPIIVWGWASPQEKITIQLKNQAVNVRAGKDGKWKASLAAEPAGGPYQLTIKGKNALSFSNVLIGDVWICSGQSNMEWIVRNSNRATEEIAQANYPTIRHFKVPKALATEPQKDVTGGEWKICTPENAGDFTAVGYFFARELTGALNVPIGLLNTSWGGTHVETWTSRGAFEASDEFKTMIAAMPTLNLDSLAKVKEAALSKRIIALQGSVTEGPSVIATWKEHTFNDSQWRHMYLPRPWEEQELGEVDGVVWFRKSVTLPAAAAGKEAVLALERIDDSDEAYINGVKVGSSQAKPTDKRSYKVPAGILKEGSNVIALRIEDTGARGGMHGDAALVNLTIAGVAYPLAGEWQYRVASVIKGNSGVGPNSYPTLLFNAMVNPLIPFAIKGALWYQGESNAGRAYQYRKAFPLMINDWRKQWDQGEFPFYFVQLASFNASYGTSATGSSWAELREAQTLTLSLPNTGMAVTTDIGEAGDIHPRNKQDVGKRLAAVALSKTYGKNNVCSGPAYQSMEVKGDKVVITFSSIGGGLVVKDRYGYLKGFEIAGADKQFRYAKATLEGNTVTVCHDAVSAPVAVRFGWADEASDTNLYNTEGFPAVPFRTDTWKGLTEGVRFEIK